MGNQVKGALEMEFLKNPKPSAQGIQQVADKLQLEKEVVQNVKNAWNKNCETTFILSFLVLTICPMRVVLQPSAKRKTTTRRRLTSTSRFQPHWNTDGNAAFGAPAHGTWCPKPRTTAADGIDGRSFTYRTNGSEFRNGPDWNSELQTNFHGCQPNGTPANGSATHGNTPSRIHAESATATSAQSRFRSSTTNKFVVSW